MLFNAFEPVIYHFFKPRDYRIFMLTICQLKNQNLRKFYHYVRKDRFCPKGRK